MAMIRSEEIKTQSPSEEIIYKFKLNMTAPAISGETVVWVKDEDGTDQKATVMPAGSPSVSGDEITLPTMQDLTAGELYTILVTADIDGQKRAMLGRVLCTAEEDL